TPCAGNSNAKNSSAAVIRCFITSPDEGRAKPPRSLWDAFSNQDHRIELLTLGLVDCHDVYAWGIVSVSKQLILNQCVIEPLTRAGICTCCHPHFRQISTDPLATIESDQIVKRLRDVLELRYAGPIEQRFDLNPIPARVPGKHQIRSAINERFSTSR